TSNPLTFIAAANDDDNQYRAIFTNNKGKDTSDAALLTVNTAPAFTVCASNITTNTDAGLCSKVVSYNTTIAGAPSPYLSYSFSGATTGSGSGTGSGSVFNLGLTHVTITAHTICAPDAVCSFSVSVHDNEAPASLCKSITVQLDAAGTASIAAAQIDNGSSDAC